MKDYTGVYELSTADSITEALGIDETRVEELKSLLESVNKKTNRVSETMEELWKVSNHPNEFAWMCWIHGANTGAHKFGLSAFEDKLKGLLGGDFKG